MCGIAGIVSSNQQLISEQRIRAGIACLRHRGPEKEMVWMGAGSEVALGHQRLCIIDLSERAAQPMSYAGRFTIIHNGELYNYLEIKQQLQQKGHSFNTSSDTEVIAAAYSEWGTSCLQQFDGMFAFAIWDQKEKQLFAARDRFGEKPFFYYFDGAQLVFASEMKALWAMGIPKKVNEALLYNFLTIGYTYNPADPAETFFQQVAKLPAASFLTYTPASGPPEIQNYWQVYPEVNASITEGEALEKFSALFSESIRKKMRSDVAVGTSLSGGLDSSAIVSFAGGLAGDRYTHKCFTASFKDFDKNELDYARQVAEKFGLQHHVIGMDDTEIVSLMENVMFHQDEPFSSASVLAQYKVFEAAKSEGVTVLLDGQGADELLAGYHKYYRWYWQELYRHKKLGSSNELNAAATLGVKQKFGSREKVAALFPELAAGLLQSQKARQAFRNPHLHPDFAFSNKRELYYATPSSFDLNGALYYNTFGGALEELLRLADRNSMAHATEVRLPYLSAQLAEFLFTLPSHFKIHEGWTKWILRRSVEEKLPQEIVWRRDKTGFEPPQKKWMERNDVKEAIGAAKKKLAGQGILNEEATKKYQPHGSYAADGWDWKYWSASFLF